MKIKNIIFDLGGVIYDIRYQNIPEAFLHYGIKEFEKYYSKAAQTDVFDLFEEGKIAVPEFRQYIRSISPIYLTDQQIDDAWNSIMIDIPKERVELLQSLGKDYRLFLFSNTNQLNYNYFKEKMLIKFGFDIFDTLFVKAYFSHILHIKKPKEEAFRTILAEQKLLSEETLFIDDSPQHIEGAKKCGLHTFHLKDLMQIQDIDFSAICNC